VLQSPDVGSLPLGLYRSCAVRRHARRAGRRQRDDEVSVNHWYLGRQIVWSNQCDGLIMLNLAKHPSQQERTSEKVNAYPVVPLV
jgi:hypothetical protein